MKTLFIPVFASPTLTKLTVFLCVGLALWGSPVWGQTAFFHSVRLTPGEDILGLPILRLHSNDQLKLSFDELDSEPRDLAYRFIHCNQNGEPSSLSEIQYMSAWSNRRIEDIRFSFNTYTNYTNYELNFPPAGERFLASGYYRMEVYDANNPSETLLTRWFWVSEEAADIKVTGIAPRRVEYRQSYQELQCTVATHGGFVWQSPLQNVSLFVQQNGRQDDIRKVPAQYMNGTSLYYQDHDSLIFEGGNEYRSIDFKSIEYNSSEVDRMYMENNEYQVDLRPWGSRATKVYAADDDINGAFVIRTNHKRDSRTEGQYIRTHFNLPLSMPLSKTRIYVLGELSDWTLNDQNLMRYDAAQQAYVADMLLKQGYYNYLFVAVPETGTKALIAPLEGSHQETHNAYHVYVFYRGPGDYYDRCLGITTYNTTP